MTNPIASKVLPGISSWRKFAKVTLLQNKPFLPRIVFGKYKKAVIICTGLHLEETSGPLTFLNPKHTKNLLKLAKRKKLSLIIYPLVNNFGLNYKTTDDEKFLRRNENGINYNDGWGALKKAKEVEIVERDIKTQIKKFKIKLALSLHEDSMCPGKGYLWMNGIKDKNIRTQIYSEIKKNINSKFLLNIKEKTIMGGGVEEGICIVDSRDPEAFEDWMANLGIGTVLSEAPFSSPFKTRSNFHLNVIKAAIEVVFNT